jgi:hypothetical protein
LEKEAKELLPPLEHAARHRRLRGHSAKARAERRGELRRLRG